MPIHTKLGLIDFIEELVGTCITILCRNQVGSPVSTMKTSEGAYITQVNDKVVDPLYVNVPESPRYFH